MASLTAQSSETGFWNNPETAIAVTARLTSLHTEVNQWRDLQAEAQHLNELADLAAHQRDTDFLEEIDQATGQTALRLDNMIAEAVMQDPNDNQPAIITLSAGAGGAEACLWTEMLLGMYTAWAELEGRPTSLMDTTYEQRGGMRSTALEIGGHKAYGNLQGEAGVHRLVRLSPLDPPGSATPPSAVWKCCQAPRRPRPTPSCLRTSSSRPTTPAARAASTCRRWQQP